MCRFMCMHNHEDLRVPIIKMRIISTQAWLGFQIIQSQHHCFCFLLFTSRKWSGVWSSLPIAWKINVSRNLSSKFFFPSIEWNYPQSVHHLLRVNWAQCRCASVTWENQWGILSFSFSNHLTTRGSMWTVGTF